MKALTFNPLVSVNIPTRNAERTLGFCLEALARQTYPNLEVIVADGLSTDGSRRIAEKYGVRLVTCSGGLLEARLRAFQASKGDYIMLVDADQVLRSDTVERAVRMAEEGYDMLVLEEESWPYCRGFIPALYKASKEVINRRLGEPWALEPGRGFFVPRFFRRSLLEKAFNAIPPSLISKVIHYDHDSLYYECWKRSKRIGVVRKAVYHIEPDWRKLWKTNVRYGSSLNVFSGCEQYRSLLAKGESRIYFGRPLHLGLQALLLTLILKTVQGIGRIIYHPTVK
ncbi:MAG: hypothetical protein DRO52_00620 [Candidatus Hecatellales archaeon]|nr:MAG: hypothetical protein DRO52_00620 [Candidatus Hecatellales archaeon]